MNDSILQMHDVQLITAAAGKRVQDDPLVASWPTFMKAVRARLEMGREEYRDRAFTRPPEELIREIEQELLDVCGWAFILWCRLAALGSETSESAAGAAVPRSQGSEL